MQKDKIPSKEKLKVAYGEATAGKWILGAALFVFVALVLLLFFTGPKGLAGNGLAPNQNQTIQSCTGDFTWCVACKPDMWTMFGAAAGGGLLAAVVGAGLTYAGEHRKKKAEIAQLVAINQ
jgi:hypothetical protein